MASIKHLKWLIIPVFAILLMSHNVSALELTRDVFLVNSSQIYMTSSTNCLNNINGGTVIRNGCTNPDSLNTLDFNFTSTDVLLGDFIQVWFYVGINAENNSSDVFVRNISVNNAFLDTVDISFEQLNNSTGILKITGRAAYPQSGTNNLRLFSPGNGALFVLYPSEYIGAGRMTHWRILPGTDYSNDIQSVVDAINSQTNPSAQDIADAVNEPEEQATENISNQSADDYEMESANMSSLFSQFGNFISAVNGASIGDCNIPADFNHIDLGILNLCANPVPDYVQVAVSIVSCMLIAPYLMNIIKRILSIADKIREV